MSKLVRTVLGGAALWGAVRLASSTLRDVTGGSMRPLLDEGDRLLVLPASASTLRPGAVVVVRDPRDGKRETVKRIVAVGPCHVTLDRTGLVVDGTEMLEPYASTPTIGTHAWDVPAGHLLALGDNRLASTDSREYGPVPPEHLVGQVGLSLKPFRTDLFIAPRPAPRAVPDQVRIDVS